MKTLRPSDLLYGKTRANDVWYRLREDILAGGLLPGEWLRFEKLRAVYDVSYATLREALSKLSYEGLVIADAQRGFSVAPIRARDLADLTSVRIMIETETLKRSIAKGDEQWRSGILAAFHKMDKFASPQVSASRDRASAHREFHLSLVAACDSPLLLEYRAALFDRANRYRRLSAAVRQSDVDRSGEHREIMEAALVGDADYACKLLAHHIQQTADDILAAINLDEAVLRAAENATNDSVAKSNGANGRGRPTVKSNDDDLTTPGRPRRGARKRAQA